MTELLVVLIGAAIPVIAQHLAAAMKKQLPWLVLPTVPGKDAPLPAPDGKGTLLKAVILRIARDVLGIEPVKAEEEAELETLQEMLAKRCLKKQAEATAQATAQAVEKKS